MASSCNVVMAATYLLLSYMVTAKFTGKQLTTNEMVMFYNHRTPIYDDDHNPDYKLHDIRSRIKKEAKVRLGSDGYMTDSNDSNPPARDICGAT